MPLSEALVQEFDYEMAITRKFLERVPESKLAWQPHTKSMPMGRLAGHLAELSAWGTLTLENDSFDLQPPGAPPYKPFDPASRQEILDLFDQNVSNSHQALTAASDEQLQAPWSLLMTGNSVFTMPRAAVLRTMVLNHCIHHRAQLGVYLRLNDIAVPSTYGPSADERV
jgi:uncharacterized damage-inducible protein DinB